MLFANAEAPDPAVAERIERVVKQGGAVIFAAGDHVNARRYNSMLAGVLPCRVGPRTDNVELTNVYVKKS